MYRLSATRPALMAAPLGAGSPVGADAATVTVGQPGPTRTIFITGLTNEANAVTVELAGTDYVVSDAGADLQPLEPCRSIEPRRAQCPAAEVGLIWIAL